MKHSRSNVNLSQHKTGRETAERMLGFYSVKGCMKCLFHIQIKYLHKPGVICYRKILMQFMNSGRCFSFTGFNLKTKFTILLVFRKATLETFQIYMYIYKAIVISVPKPVYLFNYNISQYYDDASIYLQPQYELNLYLKF